MTNGSFVAAPTYSNGYVYAGSSNGNLYKISQSNGQIAGTYNAGSAINKAVLFAGTFIYVVSENGQLHKVNTCSMNAAWVYAVNYSGATPPSYSVSRDVIIFATNDLYIHAVSNSNGSSKWRVKPSPNTPGGTSQLTAGGAYIGGQFSLGWRVIAEQHGIVFVRLQLPMSAMHVSPIFPKTNAEIRSLLISRPDWKNLFALNLDTGTEKFIPAVGYESTGDFGTNSAVGVMGSQPVVKIWLDGKEVVYIHFRNGQSNPPDWRWDSHLGEMVLDDTTIPGLVAGDLRFIPELAYSRITDEQNPITLMGTMVSHSHWSSVGMARITNRASSLGLSYSSPIATQKASTAIIRAITNCNDSTRNTTTHYTSCSSGSYVTDGSGRWFGGPSFWVYWKIADPPGWRVGSGNTVGTAYSAGFLPRYTYASNGYLIVEGSGGDILTLKHNGQSSGASPTTTPTLQPTISSTITTRDANGDSKVNGLDYIIRLNHYNAQVTQGASVGDFNSSGKVDGVDYILWLNNYQI